MFHWLFNMLESKHIWATILLICLYSYMHNDACEQIGLQVQNFTQSPDFKLLRKLDNKLYYHIHYQIGYAQGFLQGLIPVIFIAGGALGWVLGDSGWCCSCRKRLHND